MEGTERREQLMALLQESGQVVSGTQLAKILGVSRQIIVQDIALLRAKDARIVSTTKGYLLQKDTQATVKGTFHVKHDNSQIEDELCTIVDYGGKVLDVQVTHPVYGTIATPLVIANRADVSEFIERIEKEKMTPLKELTDGEHIHTVEAPSVEILNRIERALKGKNYLIP